jgi:hypothetical protein
LEIHFTARSQKLFKGLHVYPCCADGSLERFGDSQLSHWAPAGAGPAKIRRTGDRVRPGASGGTACGSLGVDSRACLAQRHRRRAHTARPCGNGRWSLCSGETADKTCWPVAQASSVGTCRDGGGLTACGEVRRRQLGRGRPWRRGGGLWEAGTVAHTRDDRGPFIGEVRGGRWGFLRG